MKSLKNVIFILTIFAVLLLLIICLTQVDSAQIQGSVDVKTAFPQLTFSQPVGVYNAGDNSNRLFVVEQAGRIQVFQNSRDATSSTVFLDIADRVLFSGEQGLLGLAFSPNFTQDGYFYLDYVAANPTRTVIERFNVDPVNLSLANKNSAFILLEINQPFSNHKGGEIVF